VPSLIFVERASISTATSSITGRAIWHGVARCDMIGPQAEENRACG
jgi:hypothetical protein